MRKNRVGLLLSFFTIAGIQAGESGHSDTTALLAAQGEDAANGNESDDDGGFGLFDDEEAIKARRVQAARLAREQEIKEQQRLARQLLARRPSELAPASGLDQESQGQLLNRGVFEVAPVSKPDEHSDETGRTKVEEAGGCCFAFWRSLRRGR